MQFIVKGNLLNTDFRQHSECIMICEGTSALLNNSNCRINNLLLQHQTILYVLSRQLILEPRLGFIYQLKKTLLSI